MSNRVTMADVAREAGVSLMTVSRVVNDKGGVSANTRRRVLEVIQRLDYRPSGIARSLATKRTATLGLVVPDVANPFFSAIAHSVEHAAYAQGYNVFLCNTDEVPGRELALLKSLEEKHVDGVILCSSRLNDIELKDALGHHPAVVLVNCRLDWQQVAAVLIDDQSGGQMAVQHLLDIGHSAIGFLAGPLTSYSGRQRAKGYQAAIADAGLTRHVDWTRHCTPGIEDGQEAARSLLTEHPELTGIFCYNDLVAVGALRACAELGRSVPNDLAVVGFDDIPLAAQVTPALTTCHVPRQKLGEQALQLLLDQIAGCVAGCEEIVIRPQLVIRASAPATD